MSYFYVFGSSTCHYAQTPKSPPFRFAAVPSGCTYSPGTATYYKDVAISTNAITCTAGGTTFTACISVPTLPAGLSISATTCAITGAATVTSTVTGYVITPTNAAGAGSPLSSISLTVLREYFFIKFAFHIVDVIF